MDKWAANNAELLADFKNASEGSKSFAFDSNTVALGIHWSPKLDQYFFSNFLNMGEVSAWTKRKVLSIISQVYDPIGWVAPIIINLKTFMQELWITGYDWDQVWTGEDLERWQELQRDLNSITKIRIKRWIGSNSQTKWTLHGFSDASKKALAAVVYFVPSEGPSFLICARTRVAPIHAILTPRLELCAAVLLAELVNWLKDEFPIKPQEVVCWTDARNVLCQLHTLPSRLGVFESHRVGKISTLLPDIPWCHVRSSDNPANCASRGMSAQDLSEFSLWWNGPSWLADRDLWPPIPDLGLSAVSASLIEVRS